MKNEKHEHTSRTSKRAIAAADRPPTSTPTAAPLEPHVVLAGLTTLEGSGELANMTAEIEAIDAGRRLCAGLEGYLIGIETTIAHGLTVDVEHYVRELRALCEAFHANIAITLMERDDATERAKLERRLRDGR